MPSRDHRDRDGVVETSEAIRASLRAALDAGVGALELRVLLAVFDLVASYSRWWDWIGTRQVAEIVYRVNGAEPNGWQRRNVAGALRRLRDVGALDYEAGIGRGARPRVTLQRGVVTPPLPGLEGMPAHTPSDEKGGSSQHERGVISARKGGEIRGHTEKSPSRQPRRLTRAALARVEPNGARDPIWDALFAIYYPDAGVTLNSAERGKLNKAAKLLRESDADADGISHAHDEYLRRHPDWADTPLALASHYGELIQPARAKMPRGAELTKRNLAAMEQAGRYDPA
jgi:hypothetical protein